MSRTTWLKIAISIILSLIIGVYVNSYLKSLTTNIQVVVAAKTIEPQTLITEEMLSTIVVNEKNQKLLTPNAVKNKQEIVGSVALKDFEKGQVLLKDTNQIANDLDSSTGRAGTYEGKVKPSYFIPSGKRAVTIKVDAEGSLSFNLQKKDLVDVIFTSTTNATGGNYSSTILKNIEIFDVSNISQEEKNKNSASMLQNITLLVTPSEAQDLTYAKRNGKIDLELVPLEANEASTSLTPTNAYKFQN